MATTAGLTQKQATLLTDLEKLAKGLGIRVFAGKLSFAGLRLKGGRCRLREDPWLVVDRFQPYEDQVELFRRALVGIEIPVKLEQSLSPEVQTVIMQAKILFEASPAEVVAPV
jgi:hypothetical protein